MHWWFDAQLDQKILDGLQCYIKLALIFQLAKEEKKKKKLQIFDNEVQELVFLLFFLLIFLFHFCQFIQYPWLW